MSDQMEGKALPTVTLKTTEGKSVSFPQAAQGKWTLLYFYPKDDTPGCTKQACSYRDNISEFKKLKVDVYGVSLDDAESHKKFTEKYDLNFPLLCDTEHKLSEALGVYGDQEWSGKKFKGLSRDTFLVGPDAKVSRVWRKVKPETTNQETLEAARELIQ